MNQLEKRNMRNGILFALPWITGFLVLQVFPICYTFYLSTTRYTGLGRPVSIRLDNYISIFSDSLAFLATTNTAFYTFWLMPIGLSIALTLEVAMNQNVKEVALYRALFYLPSVLPSFAMVFIWILFTNPQYGVLNRLFVSMGLPFINWIGNPRYTKPSLIILAQYSTGGPALIFLAGLRSIPKDLYESADLDGAGPFKKFIAITIPMLTPVILYIIIMYISNGLQAFTQAFLMSFWPLILPAYMGSATHIFMMRQYLLTIPLEISDAGFIDGANEWQIFTVLILPIMKPVIAVVAIFAALSSWNDFLGPLLYLQNERLYPLSIGLQFFRSEHRIEFSELMAASTLVALPVVVIFLCFQRFFVEGITIGAVKG